MAKTGQLQVKTAVSIYNEGRHTRELKTKKPASITLTGFQRSNIRPFLMVPETGLEPARIAPLPPQGNVSTNFTTPALEHFILLLEVHP